MNDKRHKAMQCYSPHTMPNCISKRVYANAHLELSIQSNGDAHGGLNLQMNASNNRMRDEFSQDVLALVRLLRR